MKTMEIFQGSRSAIRNSNPRLPEYEAAAPACRVSFRYPDGLDKGECVLCSLWRCWMARVVVAQRTTEQMAVSVFFICFGSGLKPVQI